MRGRGLYRDVPDALILIGVAVFAILWWLGR
jgi:hypothetical protein